LDARQETYQNLIAMGAKATESPREVGQRSELIFASLPRSEIVQEVIAGPQGILAGAKAGSIVINLSTTLPQTTCFLGQEAARACSA